MAADVVFKTKAFGGFNKQEVMDFVNRILADKSDLEKRLAEVNAKFAKTNAELNEYKSQIAEANVCKSELADLKEKFVSLQNEVNQKEEELNALKNEAESSTQELQGFKAQLSEKITDYERANETLNSKLIEIEELNSKINTLNAENAELKRTVSENTLTDETKNEIEFLRSEVTRLKMECEKKQDLERQVGAAMLDARIHSEELVEDAKAKANEVTKSVYSAIGDTAVKIDELSGGIGEIARSFTKSVEEVELRIKALTGDMSKTAQLLISESGVIAEQVEGAEATESNAESNNNDVEYDFSSFGGDKEIDIKINPEDYNAE